MASFMLCYICVIYVFCLLVVLIRLSVPVQAIDWKDSSPKSPINYNVLMGTLNPMHSLAPCGCRVTNTDRYVMSVELRVACLMT